MYEDIEYDWLVDREIRVIVVAICLELCNMTIDLQNVTDW